MSKKKIIASSVLSLAMCASVITGATFALFTSESATNIAVSAGNVDVVAAINEKSVQSKQLHFEYADGIDNTYSKGVAFTEGGIALNNLIPGDGVKFSIDVTNTSSVIVKYRTVLTVEDDKGLFEGLTVKINDEVYEGDTIVSAWDRLEVKENAASVSVEIELPENQSNDLYQGKSCKVIYRVEAVQGNANTGALVNGVVYDTLNEAVNAANKGDTITIGGDVTYDMGKVSGSATTNDWNGLTITADENVNPTITFTGYGSNNTLKNANLSNVSVVDKTKGDVETAWEHGHFEMTGGTFTNVNFVNTVLTDGDVTFNECSFLGEPNMYAAWVNSGNATFNDCYFTGPRALKAHEVGSNVKSLTVNGCTFENMMTKPGIALGDLDADTTVTITDSVFNNVQPGDQDKYIYETDTPVTSFTFTAKNNTVNGLTWDGATTYTVSSAEGLTHFAKTVNEDKITYAGCTVKLTADIDLNNEPWTPIGATGDDNVEFLGTFDGGNYTISNLNVDTTVIGRENQAAAGLFGWIEYHTAENHPVIKNLKIDGVTVKSGKTAGAIAGYLGGFTTVENCEVKNATISGTRAAAIVGQMNSNNALVNCDVDTATIIGSESYGAICGYTNGTVDAACEATNVNLFVSGQEAMEFVLQNTAANGSATINLAAGTYKLYGTAIDQIYSVNSLLVNKTVTFVGGKDAIVDISGTNIEVLGATITFDGVTVKGYQAEGSYHIVQLNNAKSITYNNCAITGLISAYSDSTFKNCTFETTFTDQYSVFCYGSDDFVFENCTFNTGCSKAIKLFNEGNHEKRLTVTNCTFNNLGEAEKAAVELDSGELSTTKYIVSISGCTLTGKYTKLWNDKASEHTVTVSGTTTLNGNTVTVDADGTMK